jgi:hypothetical protein
MENALFVNNRTNRSGSMDGIAILHPDLVPRAGYVIESHCEAFQF